MKTKTNRYATWFSGKNRFILLFWSIIVITLLNVYTIVAQTTIYSQNFETATGTQHNLENTAYLGWQNENIQGNNNRWWVLNRDRISNLPAGNNYAMAISQNTPYTGTGAKPRYSNNNRSNNIAYTSINAAGYDNVTLSFDWILEGEESCFWVFCENEDFGRVVYSLDGNNWTDLPAEYLGSTTLQNVTNLNLPAIVDDRQFYIGFRWINNNNSGSNPSFVVDNIVLRGNILPNCTAPNTPGALTLNSTSNTISGTFIASAPAANNYLVIMSQSNIPPHTAIGTPANGTLYTVGSSVGGYTVIDTDGNTNFNATGLTPNIQYYFYIYAYNNTGCVNGPAYNLTPRTNNILTADVSYCIPTVTSGNQDDYYIQSVSFMGTLNDVTNTSTFSGNPTIGYQNFTGLPNRASQLQGEGVNVYVENKNNVIANNTYIKAWVDWTRDGDFTDTGEQVYNSGTSTVTSTTFGFIIPVGTTPGNYRIRIKASRSSSTFASCTNTTNGETEDYLFTVIERCNVSITSITGNERCDEGSVNLSATSSGGTINWYAAQTGGAVLGTGANWDTPTIAETTTFYVAASTSGCESTRIAVRATVHPVSDVTFDPPTLEICGENSVVEVSAAGNDEVVYLIDEDFENTAVNNGLGVFSRVGGSTNTRWTNRESTYLAPSNLWKPAISSGFGTNNFVLSNSDYNETTDVRLYSSSVNSAGFNSLTLSYRMYYSHYRADNTETTTDYVAVEASINSTNGTNGTWTAVRPNYVGDVGIGTRFATQTVDLSAYVNVPNLRIRFRYYAQWKDGVALDDVQLYGSRPVTPTFTWNTDADVYIDVAGTIPYTGQAISTVYIKPTLTQLESDTFFDASATITLSNGCEITKYVPITNNTKIWKGHINNSTNWNIAANWAPNGIPTSDNCVILPDVPSNDPIIGVPPMPSTTPAYAKNLTIHTGADLEVRPSFSLIITDWIANGGSLRVRSGGNLIQINDTDYNSGTGSFTIQRAFNTPVTNLNYVYWSSAVQNFDIGGISSGTTSELKYHWLPTVSNGFGDWAVATGNMAAGKGYIVRGLNTTPTPNTALFSGRQNNGAMNVAVNKGNYTGVDYQVSGRTVTRFDDNWNLIGNPYPSAISAYKFILENADNIMGETPAINGTVYLWRHQNNPDAGNDDPFYGDYLFNYDADNYIAYNVTGTNPPTPPDDFDGNIASGQAFFVLMEDNPTVPQSATVTFNNSMRYGDPVFDGYNNTQFLRTAEDSEATEQSANVIERHRIWLDLIAPNNKAISTLVGYVDGATNGIDRLFDGYEMSATDLKLYSIMDEEKLAIQGRALPFNANDIIPLGVNLPQNGTYTIPINTVDGVFENAEQMIYLEDTYTNTIHNLRTAPYVFYSESGRFDNRFVLRFTTETLSNNPIDDAGTLRVFSANDFITITSSSSPIDNVTVYDVLGRTLFEKQNVNDTTLKFNIPNQSKGTLIIKVHLENGREHVKKVIY